MKFLFNPFERIAGFQALLIGFAFILVSAFLGSLGGVHFDGVLDVHLGAQNVFYVHMLEGIINWLVLTIMALIFCRFFSQSKFRVVDVAGTIAFSRWPLIFTTLFSFLPWIDHVDPFNMFNIIIGFVMLFFVVWSLILLFRALKVSANLKSPNTWIVFITVVVLAEIATKYIFIEFYGLVL